MDKLVFVLFLLGAAFGAKAIEISAEDLSSLQNQAHPKFLSSAQRSEILEIWGQHQKLIQLAIQVRVGVDEVKWVNDMQGRSGRLTIANPDHPEQQLVIVDIAQQAKATKALWEKRAKAKEINRQWQTGTLNWQALLKQDEYSRRAVHWWITQMPEMQVEQVAEHFIQFGQEYADNGNMVIATLAQFSRSSVLMEALWKRPADEFSYQLLQQLPTILFEQQAVEQLVIASHNQRLASQAFILLSRHFGQNVQAQDRLIAALDVPELQWLAAASLRENTKPEFSQRLANRYKDAPQALAKFVVQQAQGRQQ